MSARHFAEQLRLKASTLHAQGRTVTQIAAEVGRSERAVYGWVRKLKEGGAAALKRQPGTGKSLGLTKAQWLRLGRDLERKPATARVKAAQWNPSAFAVLVTKVTGKPCNRFLARRMMPVLDYYYKKPELIPEEYFTRVGKNKTIKSA